MSRWFEAPEARWLTLVCSRVKLWDDGSCSIREAFAPLARSSRGSTDEHRHISDGVTVSIAVFKKHASFRRMCVSYTGRVIH